MIKTFAAVYRNFGKKLDIEEILLPRPKKDEVIVDIVSSGICHSQLINLSRQPTTPELLGHEATGIILEKGNKVKHVNVGDKVVISWMPNFRKKEKDKSYYKPVKIGLKDKVIDAFIFTWAKKTLINSQFVTKVNGNLNLDHLSILGCAGIAGYGTVYNCVKIKKNESVIVIGAGGLGNLAINAAKNLGAKPIISIDINKAKLKFSKKFGAHKTYELRSNTLSTIKKYLKDTGADYVFDMVGKKETFDLSFNLAKDCIPGYRNGGTIILVGFPRNKFDLDARNLLMSEKTIIGSRGGSCIPSVDFKKFYAHYKSGKLNLEKIVTKRYKLIEINKALDDLKSGKIKGRGIIKNK
jgi:Zn-dependent alcohol dehydrogenase